MDHHDLLSGFVRLHVLHHAAEGEIYGQWMIEELARHEYKLSPGTLYPMLHAMEKTGYLVSREDQGGPGRRRRRCYAVTDYTAARPSPSPAGGFVNSSVKSAGTTRSISGLIRGSSFSAFAGAFATLFGAYGLEAAFLKERGVPLGRIGLVLVAGTAVRLAAGPVLGVLADRNDATQPMLAVAAALAGIVGSACLVAHGFWPLLLVGMAHSLTTASLSAFADALTLAASVREKVFAYGWVRVVESGAFVVGTLVSGQLVARLGLSASSPRLACCSS